MHVYRQIVFAGRVIWKVSFLGIIPINVSPDSLLPTYALIIGRMGCVGCIKGQSLQQYQWKSGGLNSQKKSPGTEALHVMLKTLGWTTRMPLKGSRK